MQQPKLRILIFCKLDGLKQTGVGRIAAIHGYKDSGVHKLSSEGGRRQKVFWITN
jgi:hypothetical protein